MAVQPVTVAGSPFIFHISALSFPRRGPFPCAAFGWPAPPSAPALLRDAMGQACGSVVVFGGFITAGVILQEIAPDEADNQVLSFRCHLWACTVFA